MRHHRGRCCHIHQPVDRPAARIIVEINPLNEAYYCSPFVYPQNRSTRKIVQSAAKQQNHCFPAATVSTFSYSYLADERHIASIG